MLSALSKAYVVFAVLGAAAAIVYIFGTGGDHMGGTLLVTLSVAGLCFATATSLRSVVDTDLELPLPDDAPPPALRPVAEPGPAIGPSIFPFTVAAGLTALAAGMATSTGVVVLGGVLVTVGGFGWISQSWRQHPLWTDRFGQRVGQRAVGPFSYPVLAVLLGAVVAFSLSRFYLAIEKSAATYMSVLLAAAVLAGAIVLVRALGGGTARRITAVLSGIALVAFVGTGVAGYAKGERDIEAHHSAVTIHDVELEAEGIAYTKSTLDVPEGKVRLTFVNHDEPGVIHNVGVYSLPPLGTPPADFVAGTPFVSVLPIDGGRKDTALVDTGVVGMEVGRQYQYRCDFHPAMKGTLTVVPPPADEEHGEKEHSE